MAKVIALVNHKGGVAKSTTCANLAVGLCREGKKVLAIDADAQGNLTIALGWNNIDQFDNTLATLFEDLTKDEMKNPEKYIVHHHTGIDVIPCNLDLAETDGQLWLSMQRELVLKTYIDKIRCFYDYILIDCLPSLGMVTINVLTACDSMIIPMEPSTFSFKGLDQLIRISTQVKRKLNKSLTVDGVVFTRVNTRSKDAFESMEEIKAAADRIRLPLFETYIPHTQYFDRALKKGRTIIEAMPRSVGAKAYLDLTQEVLKR